MMRVIIVFIITILTCLPAPAAPFSGKITVNTRWTGNIFINGDVIVEKGVTLTIAPGANITFMARQDQSNAGKQPDRIELTVLGTLIADGGAGENQIVFTSNAITRQMHDWYGIIIQSRDNASVLRNVVVEYAYNGLTCYGSSPTIENCTFQYNYYAGLNCTVRSAPVVRGTMLIGNGFAGINCELAAAPVIENCVINQNENGVIIYDHARPELGSVKPEAGQSVGGNHIYNNFEYNIYNRSQNNINTQNNYWNNESLVELSGTIYDRTQNSQYGKVIYTPMKQLGQISSSTLLASIASVEDALSNVRQTPQRAETPPASSPNTASGNRSTPARSNQNTAAANSQPTSSPAASNTAQANNTRQTATPAANPGTASTPVQQATPAATQPDTTINQPAPANNTPASNNTAKNATNTNTLPAAATPATQQSQPANTQPIPNLNEPVIESFLDGGRRQYIRREAPEYPKNLQKAGISGVVLMEVEIGRDGRVRNFRILRSDADAFSDAASNAIREYRYKPGTVQGQPVSYRAIERFEFKLQ